MAVSRQYAYAIQKRLREHFDAIGWENPYRLSLRLDIPHNTIAGWLRSGPDITPAVPTAEHLLTLANVTNLNPAWLLLGDAPRLRGAPKDPQGAEAALAAQLKAEFEAEGAPQLFLKCITPNGVYEEAQANLRNLLQKLGPTLRDVEERSRDIRRLRDQAERELARRLGRSTRG